MDHPKTVQKKVNGIKVRKKLVSIMENALKDLKKLKLENQ